MSHQQLLRGKEETLLQIIHPNLLLLARLAVYGLDPRTEQAIKNPTKGDLDGNELLLDWLKDSPREAFDGFLTALRWNGQGHVANYIDGTPGDMPLLDHKRKRLHRRKCYVIQNLRTTDMMLEHLYQERVIEQIDCSDLHKKTLMERTALLMEIIMRRSNRNFEQFCELLNMDKCHSHLVRCLQGGEILDVHITVHPGDREKSLVLQLEKLIAMKDKLIEELAVAKQNTVSALLKKLQAELVGACITSSMMLFTHLITRKVLDAVHKMYDSGQLSDIIRDLFRCLAEDNDLSVEVKISEESFKQCEDGFGEDGTFCISISRFDSSSSSVEKESEDLQKLRDELREMTAQVVELNAQCRQHKDNWIAVDKHLRVMENDSAARSDAWKDELEKAKQCVIASLELQISGIQSLKVQSAADVTDIHVGREIETDVDDASASLHPPTATVTPPSPMMTKQEVTLLLDRARGYCDRSPYAPAECTYLYRNTMRMYFDEIFSQHGGVMRIRLKDYSGDPRSPINGKLHGLFFFASVFKKTGKPFPYSPYGDTRVLSKVEEVLKLTPKMFFADFYCLEKTKNDCHHVVIVLTKPGSTADQFCESHLPRLDVNANPFLYRYNGGFMVSNAVFVDVFVTEDLDVKSMIDAAVATVENSIPITPRGIVVTKSKGCQHCNIPAKNSCAV